MKPLFLCISILCSTIVLCANKNTESHELQTGSSAAVSSYASMLSKAPTMLGQYYISGTTATLGSIGENIAANNFTASVLHNSGNWISLSPRVGSQGLDHIFIKTDANGKIRGLIVGESKYNSSQLGHTKDGIQMGSRWINKRLVAMGNRYYNLSYVSKIEKAPVFGNHQEMRVVLKNGREVCFWRENSQKDWKFSGSAKELPEAQKAAKMYGEYLRRAGQGSLTYRSRVFQISPSGDDIVVTIRNAANVDKLKTLDKLPKEAVIRLPKAMNKSVDANLVASELKKKMPHLSDKELRAMAKELSSKTKTLTTRVSKSQIAGNLALSSLAASSVAMGLDVGFQLLNGQEIDWLRTGITGGSVFVGTMAAQGLNIGLNHWNWSRYVLKTLGRQLGYSTTTLSSAITSTAGGLFVSGLISYGMYFAGYSDIESANVSFVAGSAGTLAGMTAQMAIMSLATTYGVAGTGTAISTLSGAAANSAALAWLGGGTAGWGMAGGAIVTGGVFIIAAASVGYTVYIVYDTIDKYKDMQRLKQLLHLLSDADSNKFDRIIQNNRRIDGR